MGMLNFEKIKQYIGAVMSQYNSSMEPTDDEVFIAWLVCEVDKLKVIIEAADNCLVCAAIADPMEVIENTRVILLNGPFDTKAVKILNVGVSLKPEIVKWKGEKDEKNMSVGYKCNVDDSNDEFFIES